MTAGRNNLTVFSSALFCFGIVFAASEASAAPQRPWYISALNSMFWMVNSPVEGDQGQVTGKSGEKAVDAVYLSRVTKEDNTITIRGHVPSDSDLKMLQGVVAATSPGATMVDKSRVNANVPDRDTWLAGMTFALRQLNKLDNGSAVLRNSFILIDGVTKADEDFTAVQKKLHDETPKGLSLQLALKPHDAHPFIWVAQYQGNGLSLVGHVPTNDDQTLYSYAHNLFQTASIKNAMAPAMGEPRDWMPAAKLALEMLSLLNSGSATLSDNILKVEGISSSPGIAELLKSFKSRMPSGFKLETNVMEDSTRSPAAARAEDISFASHSNASMNP